MSNSSIRPQTIQTKKLILLAVLCAIAYLCVFVFRIPVVSFLKYEPKDVIITLGAFLFGPLEAIIMSIVVSLVEMITISTTGPIGMIMNIISTCAFAAIAAFIYQKKPTISGAVIGLISGTVFMTLLMLLWNYLITPFYLSTPREVVADMLLPVFLPFNLLKGGLNTAITLLLYKPIFQVLQKSGFTFKYMAFQSSKKSNLILLWIGASFILISCALIVVLLNFSS